MPHDSYISPFSTRYASKEMQFIFSEDNKFRTWRKLWIALAKAEKKQGLDITDEQIAELEAHADDINYDDAQGRFFKRDMCFHAVRGELPRRHVERMTGRTLDIPTGDGGILADALLDTLPEKRYDIGIVPHVCDLNDPAVTELVRRYDNAKLINVKDDPITVLTEIAQCRCVLSSSLHGLIAADSFHIPNLHIVFSDRPLGDGYKFDDYYSAYDVQHRPYDLRVSAAPAIAEIQDGWRIRPEQIEEKKRQMRAAFPYPAVNGGSL